PPAEVLDEADRLLRHAFLERTPDVHDSISPTELDEVPLTLCERILHHADDQVPAECSPRARCSAPRVAAEQASHPVRDSRRHVTVCPSLAGGAGHTHYPLSDSQRLTPSARERPRDQYERRLTAQ